MGMIKVPLPHVELSGFDVGLNEEQAAIQDTVHRFAVDVMRPIGRELDLMPADQAYAEGSPFWEFQRKAFELGMGPAITADMSPQEAARTEGLMIAEFGWGDAGLATSAGAGEMPLRMAILNGQQELVDMCMGKLGCWCATQPSRGSDGLTLYAPERYPGSKGNAGDLRAKFVGDEIIINGQSSAWVSNGAVAQVALMDIAADYGNGFYDDEGNVYGCNIILPLDLPGVSRGKPLEKIGKRPLPQGEIYFDNVKVPARFAISTQDDYKIKHAMSWAHAGTAMSHVATGLARAAYEMALTYVNERVQGGAVLAKLQLTQYRLGVLGAKVEAIKAMARHVGEYTRMSPRPHPYFTASGKAFCCSQMFEVVNESLQLFGGIGLTREYPIEKLLRDARAMQIEDGETHLLFMHYGYLMTQLNEQEGWGKN
jgi:acyl-CoA dehydrogenase